MRPLLATLAVVVLTLGSALPATGAVWPLDPEPRVVHDFDPPRSEWGRGHRGVDLAGGVGQVVRATAAGRVTHASGLAGRGTVTVDHGGIRTTYEPVTASVVRGQRVFEGEVIGRLQLFGSHCFPRSCLHWGALRGRTYLDPLTLVGAGPIRLKPLHGLSEPGSGHGPGWWRLGLTLAGVPGGMPISVARW